MSRGPRQPAVLTEDLQNDRMLDMRASALFLGLSVPGLRRLYFEKKIPQPIKVGLRKNLYRVSTLREIQRTWENQSTAA